MTLAFLFCLASLFLPPLVWLRQYPGKYLWLLAAHALFLGAAFSLGASALGLGWPLYVTAQVVSLCLVRLTLREPKLQLRPVANQRLVVFFVLALVASADLFVILQRNGWGVAGESVYFRPPLQSDNERNAVVIEALRRQGGSPFLPASRFAYQLYWHYLAGGLLFPFQSPTIFSAVSGATLATAVFFYFLCLGMLHVARPGLFRRRWVLFGMLFFLSVHADLFQMLWSWVTRHELGIEFDWSAQHGFYRNFSLKAATLTSPQHAFVFGLTCVFLSVKSWQRYLLVIGSYVCSPVLALLFYGPYFLIEWLLEGRKLKRLLLYVGVLTFALVTYAIILHSNPFEIFFRAVRFHRHWGLSEPSVWLLLPLAWLACMGVPGLVATAWAIGPKWDWTKLWLVGVSALIFLVAADTEVRRHYSMLFALVLPFFLLRHWPQEWTSLQKAFVGTMVTLSVGAHGYFLYCMVGKPSHIDPQIPWKDYFALNQFLRSHLPGEAVLAAANPIKVGLDMPIVMEAASSFSMREHAFIHSRVTPRQRALFNTVSYAEDVVTLGKELGYRYIAWGPVEEFTWGERVRRRFLGDRLFRQGSVGLFTLEDHDLPRWRQEVRQDRNPSFALGEKLEEGRWDREAKELYELAIQRQPENAKAWVALSRLYLRYHSGPIGLELAQEAIKRDPKNAEAHYLKGLALSHLNRGGEGGYALREAIRLNPREENYYLVLLEVLRREGQRADAEAILRQGLTHARTRDSLQREQALLWKSEGRVAEAEALLNRLNSLRPARVERAEAP